MEEDISLNYKSSLSYELKMVDTEAKLHSVMKIHEGQNIRIAYSGGSDSDVMMHLFRTLGYSIKGVFYNTGLEYQATKDHIDYMIEKGFDIETAQPKHLIPWALKNYGYPFVNKNASQLIHRLQLHDFKFKEHGNKPYDELSVIYPRSLVALKWWTNSNISDRYNIRRNRGLKEYLIENNGVSFKTHEKCCDITKKDVMRDYSKRNNIQLVITGIRKAEGGRRTTLKSCYLPPAYSPYTMYFPLFWWSNEDKARYIKENNIELSDCYTKYGLERTGCVGCPFGRKLGEELDILEKFEPKLYKVATTVFKPTYEAQNEYRVFVKEKLPLDKKEKI